MRAEAHFSWAKGLSIVCMNVLFMTGEMYTLSSRFVRVILDWVLLQMVRTPASENGTLISWTDSILQRFHHIDGLSAIVADLQSFSHASRHPLYPLQIAWYLSASAQRFLLIARSESSVNKRSILLLHIVTISSANPPCRISSRNARIVFWIEFAVQ